MKTNYLSGAAEVVAAFMGKDGTHGVGRFTEENQPAWQTPYSTLLMENEGSQTISAKTFKTVVNAGGNANQKEFSTKKSFRRYLWMGLNFLEDTLKKDAERGEEKRIIDVASQTSARTDAYNSEYKKS